MSNTIMMRRFRTIGIASGIFAAGAGIGWQFADLLFQGEHPTPMVAAIHFEGSRPHGPVQPQRHETVREPAPVMQQGTVEHKQPQADAVSQQTEEERKLVDALQWADKYRQRQAATTEWERVAKYQQELQKLALAQGAQMQQHILSESRRQNNANPGKVQIEKVAAQHSAAATERIGSARKNVAATHRAAPRPRVRVNRASGDRMEAFICPLRWLHAVLMEPVVEQRGSRRASRLMASG